MHNPVQTVPYLLAGLALLALPKSTSDRSAELAGLIGRLPTVEAASVHSLLRQITRHVKTVTEYDDGTVEHNTGIGFVTDSRFFTVYHNLESGRQSGLANRTTLIDGQPLTQVYTNALTDLAVFDISSLRCDGQCAAMPVPQPARAEPGTRVYWLWASGDHTAVEEGNVVEYAWLGEPAADPADVESCGDNIIVLIDRPFKPGSSGSAVADGYGRILGIVQGSLLGRDDEVGFFKPVSCLLQIPG